MRIVPALVLTGALALTGTAHAAIDPNLVAAAKASVVTININGNSNTTRDLPDLGFSGSQDASPQKPHIRSSGSGFVIDQTLGLIVTADFVLENAADIYVQTADGRGLAATVVGRDALSGVAVLKVADTSLLALPFCPAPLRVGDDAFLIGNPYSLGILVTSGIVAGTDIDVKDEDMSPLLVLDLMMHKGTAGGPVLSPQGCVTGMAVAQFGSPGYGGVGTLGMAIPAAQVKAISQTLITSGKITRGWIGISLFEEDLTLSQVTPGSPADKAGLKAGDLILSYDGIEGTTFEALRRHIAVKPIGSDLVLKIKRFPNDDLTLTVPIVAAPEDSGQR
ncbi:protease do [Asticcacaulis biprosthecium C19]|uniref:Protease do n=1 Tax=Asticcacaulis biprosthecium C19 TaxID=715226 RepID=F4QKZ1_9CAUL|nr:trypsin-like peptidase domain-containing protein [Asticcacaulis biprosthecium]EGF92214.1 protease do [Asticcacaulis biprosthecium C19]